MEENEWSPLYILKIPSLVDNGSGSRIDGIDKTKYLF